jgi:hypothetical protein
LALEGGEIGIWIATEAGSSGSGLPPAFELLAQVLPLAVIDPAEVATGRDLQACGDAGHEPHRSTQHCTWRGCLAAGGASLMVALGAKQLLERVVGARQVRHVSGVEQAGPVTARDLAEVIEGCPEPTDTAAVPLHGCKQAREAPPDLGTDLVRFTGEEAGGGMNEAVGPLQIRPERCCPGESAADQKLEPRERARRPPFERTRSKLLATFSSRSFRRRPAASSGARPSSVIALRTAPQ